jgi:hypothetical protein
MAQRKAIALITAIGFPGSGAPNYIEVFYSWVYNDRAGNFSGGGASSAPTVPFDASGEQITALVVASIVDSVLANTAPAGTGFYATAIGADEVLVLNPLSVRLGAP